MHAPGRTISLPRPAYILSHAAVGGRQENRGPLAPWFDRLWDDSFFGEKTWEKAESAMQKEALTLALEKAALGPEDLDFVLAGDLLNQCIGTSFGLRSFRIPFFGLYGACSTMGEALALGSLLVAGGFAARVGAMTSSHFCTAERQYRMPVPYGSQRTPTAQWTATAAGCCLLGAEKAPLAVTAVTCGRIVDLGVTDANNMGAAMAPAAFDTLQAHFAIETGPEKAATLKGFLDGLRSTGVAVNLDPANFVMVTGDDPVQAVYTLKDYIVHTHAKDGRRLHYVEPEVLYGMVESEMLQDASFIELPLGQGDVDFPNYLKALHDIGFQGFLTIEREVGDDPEADIGLAVRFLQDLIR